MSIQGDGHPQPTSLAVLERIQAPRTGWVAGHDGTGGVLVDFPGNPNGPVAARLGLPLDEKTMRDAVAARQAVMLLFEEGDPRRPFLLSFIHAPSATPILDSLLQRNDAHPPPQLRVEARPTPLEIVCGETRITLQHNELTLVCGEASLTLKRNGKVVLKGVRVESHAEDVNRIKGGTVEVN
jgi:Domain of unknown function (DUF6484)